MFTQTQRYFRPSRTVGVINHNGLDNDSLRRVAPSIFAETPWQAVSDRYAFIPTIQVVEKLRSEGFIAVKAQQSLTRIPGKGDFTKHLIRFRRPSQTMQQVGDTIPEIVLINSHDRTSSYEMSAGLYRLVCSNGMVVSDADFGSIKTRHTGDIVTDVIEASYKIVEDFPALMDKVQTFKALPMPEQAQIAYAQSAAMLRWDDKESTPIQPEALLSVRREADKSNDLWTTYQRVQENLVKGGLRGRTRTNGRMHTRAINSVSEDVKLNKALWHLTTKMSELLATA